MRAESAADEAVMLKFEVATKRALEIIALDYGTDFQMGLSVPPGVDKPEPHELEVVILRAPMMFGPGYQALGSPIGIAAHVAAGRLPSFTDRVAYGGVPPQELWRAVGGLPTNYVKDNASCIQIALSAETLPHSIYNISSGFEGGARAQLEALLAVAPDCAERLGVTPEEMPELQAPVGFDSRRFEHDFGWKPGYTLESAMADYLAWLERHPY